MNSLIANLKPDLVLQCGDFGYFPREQRFKVGTLTPDYPFNPIGKVSSPVPIHWCDGNHEDHASLAPFKSYQPTGHQIARNVIYQERGSTLTLPDGRKVLFMGGADSTDKGMRNEGLDWFNEELITEKDFENLPDGKIYIVI